MPTDDRTERLKTLIDEWLIYTRAIELSILSVAVGALAALWVTAIAIDWVLYRCGTKLGGDRGGRLSVKARMAGNAANAEAADARAADVAPGHQRATGGRRSLLRAIAAGL